MTASVIVVGFGDETGLQACLEAIVADLREGDEVVLVDNGVSRLPRVHGVRILTAPRNDGFGAGCVLGVDGTRGDTLVFVNSDAVIRPGAIQALKAAVEPSWIGLATGCVVLADAPHLINAAGNPVHYLGLCWAGGFGQPRDRYAVERDIASVSGALFAMRRDVWERLGGLDPTYFLYHEDTDLSLRCHLAGLRVIYCPDAVAAHAYSFGKNPGKMFFLERNRLVTVITDYPAQLLIRVLPVILVTEPLLFWLAVRDGWGVAKIRTWWWVATHPGTLAARRRRVQAEVTHKGALQRVLEVRIDQGQVREPNWLTALNVALTAYWRIVASPRPRRARVPHPADDPG